MARALPSPAMSRLLLVVAAVAGCIVVSASSAATPDIRSKEAGAHAIVAQVQALSEEVNLAAERFNGANYRLVQLSDELRETRTELTRVRRGLRQAEPASALELILGAESLDDMLEALEATERIAGGSIFSTPPP